MVERMKYQHLVSKYHPDANYLWACVNSDVTEIVGRCLPTSESSLPNRRRSTPTIRVQRENFFHSGTKYWPKDCLLCLWHHGKGWRNTVRVLKKDRKAAGVELIIQREVGCIQNIIQVNSKLTTLWNAERVKVTAWQLW